MPESKYSPRRLAAVERQRQALELRAAGRTWTEIARALGYKSDSGPKMAVKAILQKTMQEPADRYRALTLERLTIIVRSFWPDMIARNAEAARVVLTALRDIRALVGLDAPVQHEVSGPGGAPLAVEHGFRSDLVDRLTEEEVDRAIAEAEAIVQGR